MKYLPLFFLFTLLAASCVSSKKFKQVTAERTELDSMHQIAQASISLLNQRVEGLRRDTARCNAEVRDLIDIVNRGDRTEAEMKHEIADLRKQLNEYRISLSDTELKVKELKEQLDIRDSISRAILEKLEVALVRYTDDERIRLERRDGRVYVYLTDALLFKSGSSNVNPQGKEALGLLADVIKTDPDINITIEGHTDSIPISTARFNDNWDLSVLRATSVVRLLVDEYKVDPLNVVASGRASYFPLFDNTSPQGRERNRRTEIILTPKLDELYNILENR